jgi:hypothetical protein
MTTKAQDREHAKTYTSPYGRWDGATAALVARQQEALGEVPTTTLKEASAAYAARMRNAFGGNTLRDGRISAERKRAVQARAERVRGTSPAASATTVQAPSKAELYRQATLLAGRVEPGRYALPRVTTTASGNDVTFFKVIQFRTGERRIVQLVASGSGLVEQPLHPQHQIFALNHILADTMGALALYGQKLGVCGRCGRPLTNGKSRTLGIGPDCLKAL